MGFNSGLKGLRFVKQWVPMSRTVDSELLYFASGTASASAVWNKLASCKLPAGRGFQIPSSCGRRTAHSNTDCTSGACYGGTDCLWWQWPGTQVTFLVTVTRYTGGIFREWSGTQVTFFASDQVHKWIFGEWPGTRVTFFGEWPGTQVNFWWVTRYSGDIFGERDHKHRWHF